jgi:hypothetical protein
MCTVSVAASGTRLYRGRRRFVDVLGDPDTGDAATIKSEGWVVAGTSGPTATRPPNQHPGSWHVDTTLGYSVVWDGGFWRNPITGASV